MPQLEEHEFRDFIEAIPDAIVMINQFGQIVLVNHQTEVLFGFARSEIIDQTLEILLPERFRALHLTHRTGYLAHPHTRPMGTGLELFGRRKDGNEFPIEISLSPITGQHGLRVISSIRDVSERKRLEQEAMQAREREYALHESNRRMDEFISIASHELKTPLTFLKGGIQFMQNIAARSADVADEGQGTIFQELLGESTQQIRRLERLIDDLLEVSRTQSGKMAFQFQRCDLKTIVSQIVEEHRRNNPSRFILFTSPAGGPFSIDGDPDRLGQVLTNYLTNALKYSQTDRPIEVGLLIEGSDIRVFVCDEGPGLSSQEQERIWERFYRTKGVKTHNGSGVGLGLGLYLSRLIIEEHRGTVGVTSEPGHGSTFWFTVPSADASQGNMQQLSDPVPQEASLSADR